MFTRLNEKELLSITLNVSNVDVCYDIITSFYGQKPNIGNLPQWKFLLESYVCYDYFGLEFDPSQLSGLIIPESGLELLTHIAESCNNDKVAKLLYQNLPKDYNISKLSKELIDKMIDFSTYV